MTTYNGAKYVEEQLNSLENQTFQNWDLYISDDGSSDQTLQILEKYMAQDDRIKKILHHSHHHGAFNNFYNVMRYVKSLPNENYQYFFYCDQDDIWVNEKMAIEIERLADEAQPSLCYSDLEFMTADGKDTKQRCQNQLILMSRKIHIIFSLAIAIFGERQWLTIGNCGNKSI